MCVYLFRTFRLCGRGAPKLSSCVHVARQSYWQPEVHTSWVIPCVRSSFTGIFIRAQTHSLSFFASTSSVPPVDTRKNGGGNVSLATTRRERHKSSISLTDELSIHSIVVPSDLKPKPDSEIGLEQDLPLNSVTSPSVESPDESGMQSRSSLPAGIMPTVPPASVPPHLPYKRDSAARACSGIDVVWSAPWAVSRLSS